MQTKANVERRNGAFFLVGLCALGWCLIVWSAANMSSPLVSLMMPTEARWGLGEVSAVWLMWAVMMGAMMLPSAIPMLVVHRRFSARRDPGTPGTHHWFLIAYLLTWTVFSAGAAAAQWGLHQFGALSPMLRLQDNAVAGGLLIAAGVFQLTPLKAACLNTCRAPLGLILTEWRPGRCGAVRLGFKHGLYCIGCCWALMMVLFVGGVMSLTIIAVLTTIVSLEKLVPRGELIAKLGGAMLIVWGLFLLAHDLAAIPLIT